LRINSFIATLATSLIIRGLGLVLTGGLLIIVSDPKFAILGQGRFLGIKYPVFIFAGFVILTWFILSRTTFGRYVYAIGGNAEAARLSGVRVDLIRTLTFCLTGLAAGLAGVITVSRIAQGVPAPHRKWVQPPECAPVLPKYLSRYNYHLCSVARYPIEARDLMRWLRKELNEAWPNTVYL
jgi:ribose/xylose/arabinose/galactoside ABC-type transport system permease subunit